MSAHLSLTPRFSGVNAGLMGSSTASAVSLRPHGETAEAVKVFSSPLFTPLKRGVNESGAAPYGGTP